MVDILVLDQVPVTASCMIGNSYSGTRLDWYHGPGSVEQPGPPIQQGLDYQLDEPTRTAGVLWDLRDGWEQAFAWQAEANHGFVQPPIDGMGEDLEVGGIVYETPIVIDADVPVERVAVWWQLYHRGIEDGQGPLGDYETWGLLPVLELVISGASWYFRADQVRASLGGGYYAREVVIGSDHSGNAQGPGFLPWYEWRFELAGPAIGMVQIAAWPFYAWLDNAAQPFWTSTCAGPP